MVTVADRHVVPTLDRLDERSELMGRVGEIGIGERNRPAAGGEHTSPHRRALSKVLRLHDHEVRTGASGSVGGAIRRAVVDHDDFEVTGVDVKFASDASDGVGDARLLAIGRNDHAHAHFPIRHRAAHRGGLLATHHPEQHKAVRQPPDHGRNRHGDALRREGSKRGQAEEDGEIDDTGDDRNRGENRRLTDPSVELVSPQCVAGVQDPADERGDHEGDTAGR